MSDSRRLPRMLGILALCIAGALVMLGGLALILRSGLDDLLVHLFGGFYFFLRKNIPTITTDASTWLPGLVAFGLAIPTAHLLLRSWAANRKRAWSFMTSICIVLFVPVLFAIPFIVPGAMLQVNSLRNAKWFKHQQNPAAHVKLVLRNYAQACQYLMSQNPQSEFPESLEEITRSDFMSHQFMDLSDETEVPPELPIYFGSGYTKHTDPQMPLLISPPYQKHDTMIRSVITCGGDFIEIPAAGADAWIDRALGIEVRKNP